MMQIIIDLFLTMYQCGLTLYLLKQQIPLRNHSRIHEVITLALMVGYITCIQSFKIGLPDYLYITFPLIFSVFLSDTPFHKCLFWAVLDDFLFFGTLSLVSSFFNLHINMNGTTSSTGLTLILYSFVANSLLTLMVCVVSHLFWSKEDLSVKETIIFIVIMLVCFAVNECFFSLRIFPKKDFLLVLGSCCSFVLMILILILYEWLTTLNHKKRIAELSAQTNSIITTYQGELRNIYLEMMEEQHALKQRIAVAEELISNKEMSEESKLQAISFLKADTQPVRYLSGNTAVDAIIRSKKNTMDNTGIIFELIEYPLNELPINEQSFCILLGNLLDNAIEGVSRLPETANNRYIKLSFSKVWDMLFISCVNGVNMSTIKKKNNIFASSKPNSIAHGIGTKVMNDIVNQAGGLIEYKIDANNFIVNIMLGE